MFEEGWDVLMSLHCIDTKRGASSSDAKEEQEEEEEDKDKGGEDNKEETICFSRRRL